MGIDLHTLNFLRYTRKKRAFGDTVTAARQGFHILKSYTKDPDVLDMIAHLESSEGGRYCEPLLVRYFDATRVDSIDNSDYEGATFVCDMNEPIPKALHQRYDTVIDAGTLEHVFHISTALRNCSEMCKPGGQILHVLPANNFCGHGFWQFSPELFFSLYSPANGYDETEVFQVREPEPGRRVNVHTSNRLYALVRTVRVAYHFSHKNVQQSDYLYKWEGNMQPPRANPAVSRIEALKRKLRATPLFETWIASLYHSYYRLRPPPSMRLNRLNPGLIRRDVVSLLSS